MPPKKSKAAAASSSQPVEPTRQTRAGRKRRHSDASNVSDRPSSSQSMNAASMASTPAKRRKRTRAAASVEPEVIVEEEEEIIEVDTKSTPARARFEVLDEGDAIEISSEKHVHFPSGRQSQTIALNDTDEPDKNTLDSLTPHPSKKAGKRRQTTADIEDDGAKHQKVTSTRHSLPPQLSQDGQTYVTVDKIQMAPLSEVLRCRMQRRLQLQKDRNAEILSLQGQLEHSSNDGERRRIRAEIAEIQEAQRHSIELATNDLDVLDPEMLVLQSHHEVEYPELPNDSTQIATGNHMLRQSFSKLLSQSTSLPASASQRTREEAWNEEREQFRSAIVSLSDQANQAKTKLQILEIELNALELGEGEDGLAVLRSIRDSFVQVRASLEEELPGSLPEGASNSDLIEILLANVHEFAGRLRTSDQELLEKAELIANLRDQVNGLLEHLAENKIQMTKLEDTKEKLDLELDHQACELQDVDAELAARNEELQTLEEEVEAKNKNIQELEKENEQRASSIDKLSASLKEYQLEEKKLQGIISSMEEQHASTVKSMSMERETTVRELEDHIDAQTNAREEAEQQSEKRQTVINGLELTKDSLEKERDVLQAELEVVNSELQEQREGRETAEAELDARISESEQLEGRVARTEEELADTVAKLDELRQSNATERTQRETAEADLDDAREQIEELDKQLADKGAEANQLRSKMWEIQQENTRKVKELEEAASERDQQFQADIEAEVERRQDAETKLSEANDNIEELQARLDEVEQQMRECIAERDEKITSLEAENEELLADLENTQNLYAVQLADGKAQREESERAVAALQATIGQHEQEVSKMREESTMESGLHASEMEDRNASIADLNHEVAELTEQVRQLETEKSSLEHRVEEEAEQMLQMQTEKEDQIDALKATISDKQAKIMVVEQKAYETDRRWQELLTAREEEIRDLNTQWSSSEQTVSTVTAENEEIKRRFRAYIEKASGELSALRAQAARMQAATSAASDSIMNEGAALLEEFEALDSVSALVITTTKTHSSQEKGSRSTRSSKKKRVVDSGIGVTEDEEESMMPA